MRVLTFDSCSRTQPGTRVRTAWFEERSSLPIAAACLVASGIRETLRSILSLPVTVRLLEPVIPSPEAWSAIARGATMYRFRGSVADAAIVVRASDAAALAAAAFGERPAPAPTDRQLSPIERDVLDRTIAALAGTLNVVCGARERDSVDRVATIGGFVTYFELVLEQSIEARLGIALSRDPESEPRGHLGNDDLADIPLVPAVHVDLVSIDAGALANLSIGTFLPVSRASGFRGHLQIAGQTLARGVCGVLGGRYALAVEASA
jgi:hypothetical protein